jgi:hypothetical protein
MACLMRLYSSLGELRSFFHTYLGTYLGNHYLVIDRTIETALLYV